MTFPFTFPLLRSNISQFSEISINRLNYGDYSYTINSTSSNSTFLIILTTNKTITSGPMFSYILNLPDDIVLSQNIIIQPNIASISLLDYFPLSNGEQNLIASIKKQIKITAYLATSSAYANAAIASKTPMLLQGLMLTELIYLIKYIEIKYPPNVLQIFKSNNKMVTFFFFYEFKNPEQDRKNMPRLYNYYEVSPYFLENTGEIICQNLFILFLVYLLIVFVEDNPSKSIFLKLLNFVSSLIVWEFVLFFMLLSWQKFIFYTFSNLIFHSNSSNGATNLAMACIFVIIECLFFLHIIIILYIIRSILTKPYQIQILEAKNDNVFLEVDGSHSKNIEENSLSIRSNQNVENLDPFAKNSQKLEMLSFGQIECDKSPILLDKSLKECKDSLKKISQDASFSEIGIISKFRSTNFTSALSPTLSPKKFKKTVVFPDDGPQLDKLEKKKNPKNILKLKNCLINIKKSFIRLKIIQYLYIPRNNLKFLKQYESMHLDFRTDTFWQSYFVWFDYFRQSILSVIAVSFHFNAFLQIFMMNLINICFIVFFMVSFPYKSKILFYCCLANEIIAESALLSCMVLAILDLNEEIQIETRLFFGWIIIGANLTLLYCLSFVGLVKILMMIYEIRKKKKIQMN